MDVSENSGTPKSSSLIGCSIIFTTHFGGPPLFLETPMCFIVVLVFQIDARIKNQKTDPKSCTTKDDDSPIIIYYGF